MVAGAIDARLEPGRGRALDEPGARREVCLAEARSVDPALWRSTDRCEGVEVLAHPLAVDEQLSSPGHQ